MAMPNARSPGISRMSSTCSKPSLLSTDGMMSVPAAFSALKRSNCALVDSSPDTNVAR
ncbi:hypothetical protein D3C83_187940 [compost metagenome]